MKVGYFALEGGEGSGKSAQVALLEQQYPQMAFTREPGGTAAGLLIKQQLYDPSHNWSNRDQLALFTADRIITNALIVGPAIEEGHSVLTDRSFFSSMAYQCNDGLAGLHGALAWEYWVRI